MTGRRPSIDEAVAQRDLTRAFTPGQLVLIAVAVWLVLRILRSLRR